MKQRFLVLLALIVIFTLGFLVLKNIKNRVQPAAPVATTTQVAHCSNDAKLCPDGTTVLREGAQCEFTACPNVYGDEKSWRSGTDEESKVTFKYPETLGSNYVTANQWPPKFTVSNESPACTSTTTTTAPQTSVHQAEVNGAQYCMRTEIGAAAGSNYTTYHISFSKEGKFVTMSFILQTVQCLNYESSEQSACQAAQAAFKVLELVDGIVATLKY